MGSWEFVRAVGGFWVGWLGSSWELETWLTLSACVKCNPKEQRVKWYLRVPCKYAVSSHLCWSQFGKLWWNALGLGWEACRLESSRAQKTMMKVHGLHLVEILPSLVGCQFFVFFFIYISKHSCKWGREALGTGSVHEGCPHDLITSQSPHLWIPAHLWGRISTCIYSNDPNRLQAVLLPVWKSG